MATRRQRAKLVGTGKVEYVDIGNPEEWAIFRAVAINTAPKPRSVALGYSAIREALNDAAVDPYEALPDIEPIYPHELARDIAVGLYLVYDKAWRYVLQHEQFHDDEQVAKYLRNAVNLVDLAYQLAAEETVDQLFKNSIARSLEKSNRRSLQTVMAYVLEDVRTKTTDLRTLGRDKVVAALERQQREDDAMNRLEQTLAKFEAEHLVVKLPDGAYITTKEGLESYLRSPFSEVQLFIKDPT